MFKLLIKKWLGLTLTDEDKRLKDQWEYAQKHYGADIHEYGYGRWGLRLNPNMVINSPEFKEAQLKAKEIVENAK